MSDPLIGEIVDDRWKIVEKIGAGGMGTVYRAERVRLGKTVAIKFLDEGSARSKEAVARFDREARAISRVQHPHCVSILDFGVHGRRPYIAMEYVNGERLNEEMGKPLMTPVRAVKIMRQMLEGLRHAHAHGVIHRDLKPDNVMLTEVTGTEDFVKILDFGLARIISVDEKTISLEGVVAGTPSYMSPEQALGKKADHRADLYAAGVILYGMCTGKKPFSHRDAFEVLKLQIHAQPVAPRKAAPQKNISPQLERVILRALLKDREERFCHAQEFLDALAGTPEGRTAAGRASARKLGRAGVGLVALLLLAAGATGAVLLRERWSRATDSVAAEWAWATGEPRPTGAPVEVSPAPPALAPPRAIPAPAVRAEPAAAAALPSAPPPLTVRDPPPPAAAKAEPPSEPERATGTARSDPPIAAAAAKPALAFTPDIARLVNARRYREAQQRLLVLVESHPRDASIHRALGEIYFRQLWRKDAAASWDEALRLDPSLSSEERLGDELCSALAPAWKGAGERILVTRFGEAAVPAMNRCLASTHDLLRVQAAVRVVTKVAGAAAVDRGIVALRTVELAPTCGDRRAAVLELARLKDVRARAALTKLERARAAGAPEHACLGDVAENALAALGN